MVLQIVQVSKAQVKLARPARRKRGPKGRGELEGPEVWTGYEVGEKGDAAAAGPASRVLQATGLPRRTSAEAHDSDVAERRGRSRRIALGWAQS